MEKSLDKIFNDSASGSSDLLIKLAKHFQLKLNKIPELKELLRICNHQFPSFAIIKNYIEDINQAIKKNDIDLIRKVVSAPLDRKNLYQQIFNNAAGELKNVKKIFTFSNSRTVSEILLLLYRSSGKKITVFVTESRPKNEGRILVKRLLQNRINVEFGTDSQAASFISKSDAVFCGADMLLPDKGIVNKTGTLNAAIAAAHYKKPFYVFSDSGKITSSFKVEEKSGSEVWVYNHKKLKIRNNYFEIVPNELITRIFTEEEVVL